MVTALAARDVGGRPILWWYLESSAGCGGFADKIVIVFVVVVVVVS